METPVQTVAEAFLRLKRVMEIAFSVECEFCESTGTCGVCSTAVEACAACGHSIDKLDLPKKMIPSIRRELTTMLEERGWPTQYAEEVGSGAPCPHCSGTLECGICISGKLPPTKANPEFLASLYANCIEMIWLNLKNGDVLAVESMVHQVRRYVQSLGDDLDVPANSAFGLSEGEMKRLRSNYEWASTIGDGGVFSPHIGVLDREQFFRLGVLMANKDPHAKDI